MQGYIKVNHNVIKYCDNPINYTDHTGLWLNIVGSMIISGGSEAFSQYLQHGSNFKQWSITNIAIATAFGIVPAGAAGYAAKIGIGWKGAAAVDILSSGVTNLAQSNLNDALSGDCHSAADDFVTFQYGNTYGLMGWLTNEYIGYAPGSSRTKKIIGSIIVGAQQPLVEQRVLKKKDNDGK